MEECVWHGADMTHEDGTSSDARDRTRTLIETRKLSVVQSNYYLVDRVLIDHLDDTWDHRVTRELTVIGRSARTAAWEYHVPSSHRTVEYDV